jgi:hypothetical protein
MSDDVSGSRDMCQINPLIKTNVFVGGLGPEISSGKGNDPSGRY